jgi:hypothetical protein
MKSNVICLGLQSDVHRRIVSIGIKLNELDQSDSDVVVSTDIVLLWNYVHNKLCNLRCVLFLLDSANLAFEREKFEEFITGFRSLSKIKFEIFVVGDLGGMIHLWPAENPCSLLYDQRLTSQFINSIQQKSSRINTFSFHSRTLYLVKDIISHPLLSLSVIFSRKPNVLYLGQTGLFSAQKSLYFLGLDGLVQNLIAKTEFLYCVTDQHSIIDKHKKINDLYRLSIDALADASKLVKDQPDRVAFFILSRSLMRLLQLASFSLDKRFKLITYPQAFLNVMHWPNIISPIFLDPGGINGLEAFYPRSVDLALRSQKVLSIKSSTIYNHCFYDSDLFTMELNQSIEASNKLLPDAYGFFG